MPIYNIVGSRHRTRMWRNKIFILKAPSPDVNRSSFELSVCIKIICTQNIEPQNFHNECDDARQTDVGRCLFTCMLEKLEKTVVISSKSHPQVFRTLKPGV